MPKASKATPDVAHYADGGVRYKGFQPDGARIALRFVAPLGPLALGFGLLALGDRLMYVGPLDRAQFGWLVAVPILTTVPVAAGYAWRSLSRRQMTAAAATVAFCIGVPSGFFLWVNIAHLDCQAGSVLSDAETIGAATVVGILSGLSYGLATSLGALVVGRNPPRRAIVLCIAIGFIAFFVAALLPFFILPFGLCQRPY